MKKIALLTSILTLSLMITVPQVSALEINIDHQGVMSFYKDTVLGKNSDTDRGAAGQGAAQAPALKTVSPNGQQLNLKASDDQVQVELKKQDGTGFSETTNTNRVNVNMPAAPSGMDDMQQQRSESGAMMGDTLQQRSEYQDQLLQQRQERTEEMIQLKSQLQNSGQSFQIKSREVTANLQDGAEFTIDPDTNQVMVTTPSGQTHVLYHLPDQAVEQMLASGLIDSKQDAENLNLSVRDDGMAYYQTPSNKTKKVFGILPWQKQSRVLLNDDTGEVTEVENPASSLFEQMLDLISTN